MTDYFNTIISKYFNISDHIQLQWYTKTRYLRVHLNYKLIINPKYFNSCVLRPDISRVHLNKRSNRRSLGK